MLTEGLTVVIAGRPNAGKSTLLNRLAGHDAAIVTPIAGTTRDLLREQVTIKGVPFELIDTAGLRATTADAIEEEGMRRARAAITSADHVLFIVDALADPGAASLAAETASLPANVPVTVVYNKIDLVDVNAGEIGTRVPGLAVSAATGAGLEAAARIARGPCRSHTGYRWSVFRARTPRGSTAACGKTSGPRTGTPRATRFRVGGRRAPRRPGVIG